MVDFDEGSDVFQMVTIRLYSTPKGLQMLF